eukprot:1961966-Amphidinium_carterae.1
MTHWPESPCQRQAAQLPPACYVLMPKSFGASILSNAWTLSDAYLCHGSCSDQDENHVEYLVCMQLQKHQKTTIVLHGPLPSHEPIVCTRHVIQGGNSIMGNESGSTPSDSEPFGPTVDTNEANAKKIDLHGGYTQHIHSAPSGPD